MNEPQREETEAERQERFWRNSISPERRKKIEAIKTRGTVRYLHPDTDKERDDR